MWESFDELCSAHWLLRWMWSLYRVAKCQPVSIAPQLFGLWHAHSLHLSDSSWVYHNCHVSYPFNLIWDWVPFDSIHSMLMAWCRNVRNWRSVFWRYLLKHGRNLCHNYSQLDILGKAQNVKSSTLAVPEQILFTSIKSTYLYAYRWGCVGHLF